MTTVYMTDAAMKDHHCEHYRGKQGRIIDDLGDNFVLVLWERSHVTVTRNDELTTTKPKEKK